MEEHISALSRDIQHIRSDQASMRAAIERMSEAVTRLALVEERQAIASQAIERIAKMLERIDERVRALEISEPEQKRIVDWVDRIMWAAASAAVVFFASEMRLF